MVVEAKVAIAADNAQLLRVLEESKSAMSQFFETITEESAGVGSALEGIQEKFSNAFQFTGLALATEAISKIGETIEELGTKALEIKTVSSVIGVTTDQFQAMQEAAEEAGVGSDSLTHAGEHLVSMLTEARNGSSAAIDKLLALGVGIEQVNDPTFKLNDLLQVLHERLENASTSQETMNELIVILGSRAALAAAAFKEYDGSAQSVQATMDRINGLTETQIDRVGKAKVSWSEYWTTIKNGMVQASLGSQSPDMRGMNALTMGNAGSAGQAQQAVKSGNPFDQLEQQAGQAAEQLAQSMKKGAEQAENAQKQLSAEMLQQELGNIKAGVAAFDEGSARKVAALQEEYRVAQLVYGGSQVDKVQAIYQQLIAAQKAYGKEQQKQDEDDARFAQTANNEMYSAEQDVVKRLTQLHQEEDRKTDALAENSALYTQELNARVYKQKTQLVQQSRAIEERAAQDFYQKWSGVSGAIESSFSGAISGMLNGTETFAGALQSIFSSVVDSLIQMFVKMGIQWAEGLIYQEIAQKATAISSITANSGIAATAAMASVAAIPFYGWAMAPEVGATTFAEGLSYLASASAASGFDVPAGQNPVTQLHQREMVLPAPVADTVRNAMGRKGADVHIHGKSADKVSLDQLASMLKSLGHNFKFA